MRTEFWDPTPLDQREVEKLALNGFPIANPDCPPISLAVDDEWVPVQA